MKHISNPREKNGINRANLKIGKLKHTILYSREKFRKAKRFEKKAQKFEDRDMQKLHRMIIQNTNPHKTPYAPCYTKASPIPISQMKGKNKLDPVLVMKR
ncbi:uncharacterized protein LAJ45_05367 [Morchella importuna]|uniref:uncharacterized protein n=1 Tax=Morchella importuna TaxID=1174673 RepID=UPI001E8D67FE|nr:uncharacterized protein LAJ45_05367 [Morchella importuna]KAH8150671.1 hypothetical protein LAJ45_05367 [Morchella importuna]